MRSAGSCAMPGCMRYCVSSSSVGSPSAISRVKSGCEPGSFALTVGPSWHWSPSRTTCCAPRQRATSVEASVACVASSTSTAPKVCPLSDSEPTPMQVAHTTCAPLISRRRASAASCLLENSFSRASGQYCSSSGRTESGRPRRTTRTPASARPASRLSTAMFESDVASTWPPPRQCTHVVRIASATAVLPVPGGPCTSVSACETAASAAASCESLSRRPSLPRRTSAAACGETAMRPSTPSAPALPPLLTHVSAAASTPLGSAASPPPPLPQSPPPTPPVLPWAWLPRCPSGCLEISRSIALTTAPMARSCRLYDTRLASLSIRAAT
mmetsp:Transcript_30270/g.77146  ORF Transcript_30270/g.77146 Transcript_30270/m.77146 type:complete len:328 (-) Transcript_30270:352-1335(-)